MKRLLKPLKSEIIRFFKVPKNSVFLILGPLFFTIFFGFTYSSDYMNDIPLVVLDLDQTSTSRMIVDGFKENDRYDLVEVVTNTETLKERIEDRTAYIGLFIPPHFEGDLKAKRGSSALLMVDETNIAIGNSALTSGTEILHTLNAGLSMEVLKAKNFSPIKAENTAKLFQFENRNLYDSKLSYKYYVMPGMVVVLIQQLFLSIFVPNLVSDPRHVVAKCSVHVGVGMVSAAISLLALKHIVGVQLVGHIGIATLWLGIYLFSLIGISMVIAYIFNDRRKATQFCMILSLPTFLLAGYIWPLEAYPTWLAKAVPVFWPLVQVVSPIRDYLLKGTSPFVFKQQFVGLFFFAIGWLAIGVSIKIWRLLLEKKRVSAV